MLFMFIIYAMGAKEATIYAFTRHVQYIYMGMDTFCREQESEMKECVEKLCEKKGKGRDKDEKLSVDARLAHQKSQKSNWCCFCDENIL